VARAAVGAEGYGVMRCCRCDDCGWVCEAHHDRPSLGESACTCGAAGAPCPACNSSDANHPPRPPEGLRTNVDDKGWQH
jgi:hypothetical protein